MTASRPVTSVNHMSFSRMKARMYSGTASSRGAMRKNLMPSNLARALMREWTVRPFFRSPHRPTDSPSTLPRRRVMVVRSAVVWVGCMCPPSPALITGTSEYREAALAAPSLGLRMTTTSA